MSSIKDILHCYKENSDVYQKLFADLERERVVPFVGAGISADYYPTWKKFLMDCIAGEGKKHEDAVTFMIEEYQYEEAASYIQEVLGEMRFGDKMQSAFSYDKLATADLTITLQLICLLFRQAVITTNYDHVLKWAFEKMGNPFLEQVTPRRELDTPAIDRIWRQHSLIKLHGSISREEDIVLTKAEYDEIYGESCLLKTPFTKLLRNIYTNNVLLFLGCSLNVDRTMNVLETILKTEKRDQYHYAFMELPEETENTSNPYEPFLYQDENKIEQLEKLERRLSNYRIRVIWFPYHKYECIAILLDELCKELKKKSIDKADISMSKYGLKAVSSFFINQVITDNKDELEKYRNDFMSVNTDWKTVFPVICNNLDIPNREAIDQIHELIKRKKKRILLTGYAGIGKSTVMLRAAVEQARKGRNVYWLNLEQTNNIQTVYDQMIQYIHDTSMPKIPAILFVENPYYGREELLKLGQAFSGRIKNIQIVISERVQRLYELTYESDNFFFGWFEDVDVVIMHSQNTGISSYEFLENMFYSGVHIINVLWNREWIKEVLVNFAKIKLAEFPKNTINMFLSMIDKKELYAYSLVEIQYRLLFEFADFGKKIHTKNKLSCLLDWDEWANRLVAWKIVESNDSFEYYQMLAVFGLFNFMVDLDDYTNFHSIKDKKRNMIQKLYMMIGEYNIEPLKFYPEKKKIGPKHDIICELFFLFHPRWNTPFTNIFPYITKMNTEELNTFIHAVHLNIRNYNTFHYKKFNWMELLECIIEAPAYAILNKDKKIVTRIVQCKFWSYVNQNDLNEAYSYLKEQLYKDEYRDNWYLLNDFASLCTTLELEDEAIEVLERVIKINEMYIPSIISLGKLYFYYKRDFVKSKQLFKNVLNINSRHSVARRYLAKILDEEEKYEDAEKEYEIVLKNAPSDYITMVDYGNHFLLLSKEQQAIHKYKESLNVFPNNRVAVIALGKLYLKQKKYGMAENYLKRALRNSKLDLDVLYELSNLFIATGRKQEAVELYLEKGKVSNNSTAYLSACADMYQRIGETRKAIQKYQEALKISPINSRSLLGLVNIYVGQDKVDLAEALLKDTFKKFSNYPHILKLYIKFLEDNERKDKISDILDNYVDLENNSKKRVIEAKDTVLNISANINKLEDIISLGELYRNLGMYAEADILYKNANVRFPNNVEILWGMGQVYLAQKNHVEAVSVLRNLLEIQPNNYTVRAQLAQLYVLENNYEEVDKILFCEAVNIKRNNLTKINRNFSRRKKDLQGMETQSSEILKRNNNFTDMIVNEYHTAHALEIVDELHYTNEETIQFFNNLIKKNPGNVMMKNTLIEYYGKQEMYSHAKALFSRALAIHHNHVSIYLCYGRVCFHAGKFVEAVEVFREAAEFYPKSAPICMQYAKSLEKVKRIEEAASVLLQLVTINYSRDITYQLITLYHNCNNIEARDSLIADVFGYYENNVNELISLLHFCIKNKMSIENHYLENIIYNFRLTEKQKKSILKIFRKLYINLQVNELYEKIDSSEIINDRKLINVLYSCYKDMLHLKKQEEIWKYALSIMPEDNHTLLRLFNFYVTETGLDDALDFMKAHYEKFESAPIAQVYYNFLMKHGFQKEAEELLSAALIKIPEAQQLLVLCAKQYRMKGDIEEVKNILNKLIYINPNNESYTHQLASLLISQGNIREAEQVCSHFLQAYPQKDNFSVRLLLIDIYLKQQQFELVNKLLSYLIEHKYYQLFSKEISFKEFIKWSLEHQEKERIWKFTIWLNKNKRMEDLIYLYEALLEEDDENVKLYYYLGNIYDKLYQHDKALYYLEKGYVLLDKDKHNAEYYHRLASVYRKLFQYDKAYEFYKAELSVKESFYGYSGMGRLHIWMGKLDIAENYLLEATKLLEHRPSPSVYLNFGILKLYQGKFEDAKKFLDSALKISQKKNLELRKIYYWLAKLYAKMENEEQKLFYFKKISKMKLMEIEDPEKIAFLETFEGVIDENKNIIIEENC